MIVDKKTKQVISNNAIVSGTPQNTDNDDIEVFEQMPSNGVIQVLNAIKEILRSVTWEYGNPKSPKIFKTVQVADGQYERIENDEHLMNSIKFLFPP